MHTESVEKAAPRVDKVKENKISKQKPKITGQERWQKGKSHKRFALEKKETEFLNCATQLGQRMLDSKEEGVMSNDGDNGFGNLVRTNSKHLHKRLKLVCQNEIHQVTFK